MNALKRPAAIFLDWDGTLVDSFAFLLEAHNHTLRALGREPFTHDQFMEYFGQPRETLYKNLYGNKGTEAKALFEAFVLKHHLKFLKPIPGAADLLKAIHDIKIPMGIVSNKRGSFVRAEIKNFGWTPMFSAIVGSGEAPQDKPAADPLLLGISLAGVTAEPGDIWYVGDSETDAQCARNAGCLTVLIDHGDNISSWIGGYNPALIVKNCPEFTDFLLQTQ